MKRNRWLFSLLLCLTGLSALGVGASVAWYAAASQLKISQIEISVLSERNLKVSTSAEISSFEEHKYSSEEDTSLRLNTEDQDSFKPVSSMYSFKEDYHTFSLDDEYSWMERKDSAPVFADGYMTSSAKVPAVPSKAKSGYFTKEIYLLADDDCYVTLDPETCLFNGYISTKKGALLSNENIQNEIHEENKKMATKLYANQPSDNDVEKWTGLMDSLYKALRVSLLVPDEEEYQYYIIDPFKEIATKDDSGNALSYEDTYFAGRLNADLDEYYDTYTEEYDEEGKPLYSETLYGDIDESTREKAVYGEVCKEEQTKSGRIDSYSKSSFNAYTKMNTKPLDFKASLDNGLIASKEHSYALAEQGDADCEVRIPVYRNKVRKVVLSIYLEGWDSDCINNTMGASFMSTLSFKIAREM